MADTNDLLKAIESIKKDMATKSDLATVKNDLQDVKQDIANVKQIQGQQKTMAEAVLAGQQELQKTAAREVTVMKFAERLTRKVNDHEERITELEKEAGIPHPHKH